MARSGYCDDIDQWALIRWRGAVASAIRGRRGQAFLQEMLSALDALPEPRLVDGDLIRDDGSVCALGAVGLHRGMSLADLDPGDRETVAEAFGIPLALACEVMFMNDDDYRHLSPEDRFSHVREWVVSEIRGPQSEPA